MNWKHLLTLLLMLLSLTQLGCLNKNLTPDQAQQQLQSRLDALKQANFRGRVRMILGGNPLGFNIKTNWSLGPENSSIEFEGDVDFTKPVED